MADRPQYPPRMSLEVLQRSDWYGEPKTLGDTFRLHKERCGQQLEAAGRLVRHTLGWELRLEVSQGRVGKPTGSLNPRRE